MLIPRGSVKTDWEVELGIVIGSHASYLADETEAAAAIAGYVLVNDVSEREWQIERGGQWSKGKSAPTFNPAGPWLVTPDEIGDVLALDMWLDIDGRRRQTGSTSTMIFSPTFIVHYLSQFLALEPGDLINTGTPPGVGLGQNPPTYLHGGETMTLGITRLGTQTQHVIARSDRSELMRALVVTAPRAGVGARGARPGRRRRASCSSTSSGSASAAPTSSSTPARWPTSTRGTRTSRSASATSGPAASSASATPTDERWIGKRVTGDTMLGCGHCEYCLAGHHHVCPNRFEVGIRDGWAGALAEKVLDPDALRLRDPRARERHGGRAGRTRRQLAARRAGGGHRRPGRPVLVLGSGTIGLLAAQFALAAGAEVHVGGVREGSLALARSLGVPHTWQLDELAASASDQFDAVIEATSNEAMPALSVRLAKPAGRVVYIGLSSTPSLVDTRDIALKDITAVGILSASPGLAGAIEHFADGSVVPDAIVSEVVALEDVPARLEGPPRRRCRSRPEGARRPAPAQLVRKGCDHDRPESVERRRPPEEKLVGADRVIAVLTELADHPLGVTLDELAGILRSSKPTVHRALATLRRAGLADMTGRGVYILGDEYLRLAFRNLDGRPENARIQPLLEQLAAQYGETDALRRPLRHGHRLPREDGSRRRAPSGSRR